MSSKQRYVVIHHMWGMDDVTLRNRKARKRLQRMHNCLRLDSIWRMQSANRRDFYSTAICCTSLELDKLMQVIRNHEWRTRVRRAPDYTQTLRYTD